MEPNPTWTAWGKWLGSAGQPGTICKDVVDMLVARQIWESFNAIVGVAPIEARKNGTFHSWFNSSYARTQGLAIRRQVEARDDVVTLGRLLDRISKAPNVLSRERYLAELHPHNRPMGNEFFDQLTTPGAKAIDPSVPNHDLARLQDETKPIKRWIDKEVAHYDPQTGTFIEEITFGKIHAAIDLIFKTMNRYTRLLLGTTIAGSVAMTPWEAVFRVAWVPDESSWLKIMATVQETDHRRMGELASGF
jgi:hypothetical protein